MKTGELVRIKDAVGRKVLFTSPNTGRTYECWVIRRTHYAPAELTPAHDYSEFDFRLVPGTTLSHIPEDSMVALLPKTKAPKWVREQSE